MPTEYIPKSLALDIIARLCTDYSAAYAEISAIMGVFMADEPSGSSGKLEETHDRDMKGVLNKMSQELKKNAEKLFKTIDTANGSISCITTDHFVETTEKVENMNKPLKDWTLGEVKKLCAETGMDCEKCPFSVKNEVPPSCRLENDPPDNWDLSERPRWTERDKEDAMMIKRVFNGFQIGIARDTLAQLRTFAKDDYPSEYINSDMFPSLKPGESVTLDEIIGANNADNI